MAEQMTEIDEVHAAERMGAALSASIRATLCLDWGCEDFGLPAAIELRSGRTVEFSCPHGRVRCPLP